MSLVLNNRQPISRYRPPQRVPPPLPPRWTPGDRELERTRIAQFVFLSMLLHALAIVLFGAPSGGSREGRAVWGDLKVELQRAGVPVEPMIAPKVPPVIADPAPGTPLPEPPAVPAAPAGAASGTPAPMPEVFPRLLDRLPSAPRTAEPPLLVPPPTDFQVFPPPPPQPRPWPKEVAAPPLDVARPAISAPPTLLEAPPVARPEPQRIERAEAETPPIPAPLVQPLALPEPVQPALRPLAETPSIAAAPPAEAVRPVETPPPVAVQAAPAAPSVVPAPAPAPPPVAVEPLVRPLDRALTQEVPVTPPRAPTALERALTQPPEIVRAPEITPEALPGATVRGPSAAPFGTSPFPRGSDRPSGDYDPTKGGPGLDLDALRNRANQLAREGSGNRSLLPFPMPPVETPKSRVETALEKARKPDCKDAYKHLGLAAIVPLLANEFGEGSCRW